MGGRNGGDPFDEDGIFRSHFNVVVSEDPPLTVKVPVQWQRDDDALPEARYIASCASMSLVTVGPDVKKTGARLEIGMRKQIHLMKLHGKFADWVKLMSAMDGEEVDDG